MPRKIKSLEHSSGPFCDFQCFSWMFCFTFCLLPLHICFPLPLSEPIQKKKKNLLCERANLFVLACFYQPDDIRSNSKNTKKHSHFDQFKATYVWCAYRHTQIWLSTLSFLFFLFSIDMSHWQGGATHWDRTSGGQPTRVGRRRQPHRRSFAIVITIDIESSASTRGVWSSSISALPVRISTSNTRLRFL